jgi:hypothetical protein
VPALALSSSARPRTDWWTLSADRKTVRLAVPPLRLAGFPKPLDVYMDFDAVTVDAMLERLTILRSQMLPKPLATGKRN